MSHRKTPWSDEKIQTLKELWESGWSCIEISIRLGGVTRAAVIGKVNRLGLKKRRDGTLRAVRPIRARLPRQLDKGFTSPSVDFQPENIPVPEFLGIEFLQTTEKTCMYPHGEGSIMLFCGQPRQEDSSYCAGHHRICWRTPERKVYIGRAA